MSLPSVLVIGTQPVTVTPTALTNSSTLSSGLVVTASLANNAPIYVGTSGSMTTAGSYGLNPGDSVSIAIDTPSLVFVAVAIGVSAQEVAYLGS